MNTHHSPISSGKWETFSSSQSNVWWIKPNTDQLRYLLQQPDSSGSWRQLVILWRMHSRQRINPEWILLSTSTSTSKNNSWIFILWRISRENSGNTMSEFNWASGKLYTVPPYHHNHRSRWQSCSRTSINISDSEQWFSYRYSTSLQELPRRRYSYLSHMNFLVRLQLSSTRSFLHPAIVSSLHSGCPSEDSSGVPFFC